MSLTEQAVRSSSVLGILFLVSLVYVQCHGGPAPRGNRKPASRAPHIAIAGRPRPNDCIDCHAQSNPGIVAHWEGQHARGEGRGVRGLPPRPTSVTPTRSATTVRPHCHGGHAAGLFASATWTETAEFARQPPREGRQHPGIRSTTSWPKRWRVPASASTPTRPRPGSPRSSTVNGHGQRVHGRLPAVPRQQGGAARQPTAGTITRRRTRTRRERHSDQPGRGRAASCKQPGRQTAHRMPGLVAQHRASAASTWMGPAGRARPATRRHDFSPRRARQPENCGKCHLGPDHPQKEIYEESKHGVAFRDLKRRDEPRRRRPGSWARTTRRRPTCATCHMSGHLRNGGKVTHDPGERISWTNRPPGEPEVMDTDINHAGDHRNRSPRSAGQLDRTIRGRQKRHAHDRSVQSTCHTPDYINGVLLAVRRLRRAVQREVRQGRARSHHEGAATTRA